jgi:hypothetical protein
MSAETLTAEQLYTNQNFGLNRHERLVNDTTTWLAETLHGSMRTSFEYQFDGQELYGEDGGAVGEIFDEAIETARVITDKNPNLLFELRRRLIEKGEYEDMVKMAQGELPNTMIVVSDFPPELMEAKEDIGGYNATRQQTMLRVITRQQDGSIRMATQSLDGSNRQALEAIYGQLGAPTGPGELLEQRVHRDLPPAWQDSVINNLTQTYDQSLNEQYGGNWHAGIRQSASRQIVDTYEFAASQHDLVDLFVEMKLSEPVAAEKMRARIAATMYERYERHVSSRESYAMPTSSMVDAAMSDRLQAEIELASQRAQSEGRVFSGCGASVSLGNSQTEEQLDQSGYGNKADKETNYRFDKKMHCVVCQPKPKKDDKEKMCGPCGICQSCDKRLRV